MYYELSDHFVVAADLQKTWAFFSDANNLPTITPPWLGFTIKTKGPVRIVQDSLLDYTIKWAGIPIHWRTRIVDWHPPTRFVDLQIKGPYALWHHEHTFEPTSTGVVCRDRVLYKLPLPVIGRMMNALVVRKQLLKIFAFRRKVIGERLGWIRAVQENVEIRKIG